MSSADTHVVERGETLEHVAHVYGCSTEAVLRANRLDTTLVPAGTVVTVPACGHRVDHKPTRTDDDRARRALAVIDGAAVVHARREVKSIERPVDDSHSIGQPWNGKLVRGMPLPAGDGYHIRRPTAAYGADHVVAHLQHAIAEVRALYPRVHTLAIGDLSSEHGGQLARHASHQSGLDVDVGFYFTSVPKNYPDEFAGANAALDLEATWALIIAFARTQSLATGVQIIFLDYDVQARLYRWARARGTPDDELATLLQYPHGKETLVGLVRHWPSHEDHMHVRFKGP